ncbi:MAG: hypothetical protein AAGU17_13510 [Anaerolineaceae bacterium]
MTLNALVIVIIGFVIMESANVISLYFLPGSKFANGIGVFKAWEKSKQDPEVHDLVKYLVNWVAGTKVISILLLVVILLTAQGKSLIFAGAAMVVSIATFFWRLFPLIRKMDRSNQIEPKNYSATLGWMILGFILVFLAAVIVTVLSSK